MGLVSLVLVTSKPEGYSMNRAPTGTIGFLERSSGRSDPPNIHLLGLVKDIRVEGVLPVRKPSGGGSVHAQGCSHQRSRNRPCRKPVWPTSFPSFSLIQRHPLPGDRG